jgi:hypothetical protein
MVSWCRIRCRSADRRGKDSRRWEEALASHASLSWERDTKPEERGKVSGEEREHRTTPRRAIGSLSGPWYRWLGAQSPGREGGEPTSQGPTGGKATPGITFFWKDLWERLRAHQPSP